MLTSASSECRGRDCSPSAPAGQRLDSRAGAEPSFSLEYEPRQNPEGPRAGEPRGAGGWERWASVLRAPKPWPAPLWHTPHAPSVCKTRRAGGTAGGALTCRTSCRSPAGSTQLTSRSSRSMSAEVPMCLSTRLTNLSFFFRNTITWTQTPR